MAQEALQRGEIYPAFHRLRGKGMAQGMNTARFSDACPTLGRIIELLRRGGIHRPRLVALEEHPGLDRTIPQPVLTQDREQAHP